MLKKILIGKKWPSPPHRPLQKFNVPSLRVEMRLCTFRCLNFKEVRPFLTLFSNACWK